MSERLKLDIQKFAQIHISTHSSYYQGTNSNTPYEGGDCRPYFTFYYEQNAQGQTIYTMNVYAQIFGVGEGTYSYNITTNIAGETNTRTGNYYTNIFSGLVYLYSISKIVNSNVDGSGIQISYSIYGNACTQLGWGAKSSSTYYFKPPTVPLGATLNSISNFNVGEDIVVGANINNASFSHTLNIKIGDVVVATRNITTASTTISFTEEELDNIYNAMNLNSATFTFELITKNGDTQIGVASTRTATGTLTDVKPVIDSFEISLNNPVSANNNIIKGVTNASFTIFVTTKKNATISKVSINNINANIFDEGNGIYRANLSITRATTGTFNLEVIDSRGNVATDNKEFTLIDYVPLSVGATFERASSTSGEISVDYSGNYWSGNFGGENNTLNVSWKYREKGSSNWIDGTELTPTIDDTNMKFYQYTNLNTEFGVDDEFFDYQKDWEIQIICVDKITQVQAQYTVVKGIGILELYKTVVLVNGDLDVQGNIGNIVVEDIKCKNLFNKNDFIRLNAFIDPNGKYMTASLSKVFVIEIKPNTTYTVSKTLGTRLRLATSENLITTNNTPLPNYINKDGQESATITSEANDKYLYCFYYDGSSDASINESNIINSIQVEKGSVASSYIEFKKYGYNENESMGNIVVDDIKCKNLLTLDNISSGSDKGITYSINGSEMILNGTSNDRGTVIASTPTGITLPAGTYILSVNKSGTYNNGGVSGNDSAIYIHFSTPSVEGKIKADYTIKDNLYFGRTFTFTEDTTLSFQLYCNSANQTFTNLKLQFQIEKGEIASSYVPYKEFNNKQIYSANEQVIGTYLDKPLYRKVVILNISDTTSHTYNLSDYGITNIDTIFVERAFVKANSGETKTLPSYETSTNYSLLTVTNTQIICQSASQWFQGAWNIILNYTKTTDTASIDVATIDDLNNSSSYSLRNGDENTNELY